jgi:hypothetical protein
LIFGAAWIDANWVDVGAVVCSVAYTVWRWSKCTPRRLFIHTDTGTDFAKYLAIFPLAILAVSPFSSRLLSELFSATRITLCVAGVVALIAILRD